MKLTTTLRLGFASIIFILTGAASAQQLLMLTGPNSGELFGQSVAALPNGNVVVGAVFANPVVSGAGRVYVFDPASCNAVDGTCADAALQIDSPNPTDQAFGTHIATTPDGDILIGSQSRVLIFDGSATGTTNLPARTIEVGDLDGGSNVSAIAATAAGDIVIGVNGSRVFVFSGTNSDAAVQLTIIVPNADGNEFSVQSLAVSGDRIVVGTRGEEGGRAFLFDGSGTGTIDTPLLTIGDPTPESSADGFAETVAITPGGDIVVGARLDDSGTVYVFDGDAAGTTSTPILTLKNPDHFPFDGFGNQVASTSDGHIIIGADVDLLGEDAPDAGSAYVFNLNTCDNVISAESDWPDSAQGDDTCEVAKITINNPFPSQRDLFGKSVASLPDGTVIVGAPQDETGGASNGNVFLFEGPAQDDDGNPGCLRNMRADITDHRNLIIVGTSLVDYIRCAGLIPNPPEADRICFPDCFDDPACHDDGCPYPFISVNIDPLILESIEPVLAGKIDEITFKESLRASLASNKTTLTYQPPSKARGMIPVWAYVLVAALGLVALLLITAKRRNPR